MIYIDKIQIKEFSIHELNEMMQQMKYVKREPMDYRLCMPEVLLDFGLQPLGNDQDVINLSRYVGNFKEIKIYIEHGQTHQHTTSCLMLK